MSNLDPQPLIPYDPLNPSEPTKANISRRSKNNRNIQLNNPKNVAPNQPVEAPTLQSVTSLPIRRRPKPVIVPPGPVTPAEYTNNFTSDYITPPPGPSGPPRRTLPGVRPYRASPTGGRRHTRRKHKKSRKTYRRRN
jgi:hypothetical protein